MRSLSLSSAAVASSRTKILGWLIMARAMATRCRCPPLSSIPPLPISVSYCRFNDMIVSWMFASLAAFCTSSSVAPGLPMRMLSLTVPANSTGICPT
mmetsp:Transcript_28876/g.63596  ORF Transcript_28876/g.63596 Transcript_28876/m.63596 type:complete len:97 (-) Transcript_28876:1443-1733(-)